MRVNVLAEDGRFNGVSNEAPLFLMTMVRQRKRWRSFKDCIRGRSDRAYLGADSVREAIQSTTARESSRANLAAASGAPVEADGNILIVKIVGTTIAKLDRSAGLRPEFES